MIERIKGKIEIQNNTHVVVFLNGFGFEIKMSEKSIRSFSEDNKEVLIFTYLHVKEDALDLYGFFSEIERKTFLLLITINGIGPKLALTILSGMRPDRLNYCIANNDLKSLTAIAGVGSKTAKRIVLELKDKVLSLESDDSQIQMISKDADEAITALEVLGYSRKQTSKIVNQIKTENHGITVESLIKKALNKL